VPSPAADPPPGTSVALRDGSRITIRPIGPGDREELAAGFERLSEESRLRRFLAPVSHLTEAQLDYLTQVDHHDHEALVAIDEGTGAGVGVARFVRTSDERAEPAVAVADDWQGRGVGGALIDALAERARAEAVESFEAVVLAGNERALALVAAAGGHVERRAGPELHVVVPLGEPEQAARSLIGLLRAVAAGLLAPGIALAREPQVSRRRRGRAGG
jgi:GNAT superfamily N-acetyltransferase